MYVTTTKSYYCVSNTQLGMYICNNITSLWFYRTYRIFHAFHEKYNRIDNMKQKSVAWFMVFDINGVWNIYI